MKETEQGHTYELQVLDAEAINLVHNLIFVKREGKGYPGNRGHHSGTNIQEVLRACIRRVKYLNSQIACTENEGVLLCLKQALYWLEVRAARQHGRELIIDMSWIEDMPFCNKCGHIGCGGECHAVAQNL